MNSFDQNFKTKILDDLKRKAEEAFLLSKESYQSAMEHSRSDDMKSEGKYDTRAIEAGYLASASKGRMQELQYQFDALQKLDISPKKLISVGSLVALLQDGKQKVIFITPGTSLKLEIEGIEVQALSMGSPLIKESMGLGEGDGFSLETPQGDVDYEILSII